MFLVFAWADQSSLRVFYTQSYILLFLQVTEAVQTKVPDSKTKQNNEITTM